jgi:hypothetical protein
MGMTVSRSGAAAGQSMLRRSAFVALMAALVAGAASLTGAGLAPAGASVRSAVVRSAVMHPAVVHWGRAREVPGLAALNAGGGAQVSAVSCWHAGDCAAGGSYSDAGGKSQAFVVLETGGRWANAMEVPGTAALNAGGGAQVDALSCAPSGGCAAGGWYSDSGGHQQAFVVSETGGRWANAAEVRGSAALNVGGYARILSLSCSSAGNCGAGGWYQSKPRLPGSGYNSFQAFVVAEKNGRWAKAEEVPGLQALNPTYFPDAETVSVSCASQGNCTAGGFYNGVHAYDQHPFMVSETNGRWGRLTVPRVSVDGGGSSVSCWRAGDCVAVGWGQPTPNVFQGFVITETNGRWGKPLAGKSRAGLTYSPVSCPSAGNCAAAGNLGWAGNGLSNGAFVVDERNASWGKTDHLAGLGAQAGSIGTLSCTSAGNCGAGGSYFTGYNEYTADPMFGPLVVGERNGKWSAPEIPPGVAALNLGGNAQVTSVSCATAGACTAGGFYTDASGHGQAFVDGAQ